MFFSDYFCVNRETVEDYGAFDISLASDLPLFVDPFLLFNSPKPEYQKLHNRIIGYLRFLRDVTTERELNPALIRAWFQFPEVKQTWLGFTATGNRGSGLGAGFAFALSRNLDILFKDFGSEKVTKGSHLEKLCLIGSGVGKDNISDFTTNLIKPYLLEFTEEFTKQFISPEFRSDFAVSKVVFNEPTRTWSPKAFLLPRYNDDFVILTPRDILTKDDTWISRPDLLGRFDRVARSLPNAELRELLNDYLSRELPRKSTSRQRADAYGRAIRKYPEVIDHYIREKEDSGDQAVSVSQDRVRFTREVYLENVGRLARLLRIDTRRLQRPVNSFAEAMDRANYLKHVIENNDGYRLFYVEGKPIQREEDLQLLFRLTWYKTEFDVNAEVNNGRGPVDYKISKGMTDKTLVEFKLAKNRKLKQNLENQVAVYEKANQSTDSIKVILYFTSEELERVYRILEELDLSDDDRVILIDGRRDNKPSASNAAS